MNNEESKATKQKLQIFGSFFLANHEFAIAVETVREVVNPPAKYTVVPLSPDYLKGIFNLRGTVVPVIDLRTIFQFDAVPNEEGSKIAIIEYGKHCIGVLFDRTGEIFHSNTDERFDFTERANSSSSRVISGVFKKEQGKRILQILDIEEIFKLEAIPYQAIDDKDMSSESKLFQKRGNRKQCISFVVGPSRCSLSIDSIHEIIRVDSLNDSAFVNKQCIGSIDLRGSTIPIVDFAALLGFREPDRSNEVTKGNRRIIVMRLEQELFGLLVDSVESIVSFFSDELKEFPIIAKSRVDMFSGCISRPGENDILLLDHSKILSNSEISEITHGHSKIFKHSEDQRASQKTAKGQKKTCITFTLENRFAVAIEEVKEIIEYPKDLLIPPGLPAHCKGILNLRGELVTIVDARAMYSLNAKELQVSKVLIFKNDDIQYGLAVDSVDSIVSFNANEKLNLPELLYKKSEDKMIEDIMEAIEVSTQENKKVSLLILNTKAIHERVAKRKAA